MPLATFYLIILTTLYCLSLTIILFILILMFNPNDIFLSLKKVKYCVIQIEVTLSVQLVNHGLNGGLLQQIKADITEFFSLTLEEKSAVAIAPNGVEGFGHLFVFDKQQKLDWSDMLFLTTRPVEERKLDFWPTKPSTFR